MHLIEHRLSRNETCCVVDNHNYVSHTCAKGFLDLNFNKQLLTK